jgi:flavin reductase (DIM6/NTAB) family NADH-FMN oxidoreductase RutF
MTMSWHMMVEFEPPLVACVVSNANFSFAALRATKECVIAVPPRKLAVEIARIGNCSGRNVDKFKKLGLTAVPSERVAPPLVVECFANLECRVVETRLVSKFNIFILEVVKAWIDPAQKNPKTIHHHGYGRFALLILTIAAWFGRFRYRSGKTIRFQTWVSNVTRIVRPSFMVSGSACTDYKISDLCMQTISDKTAICRTIRLPFQLQK